MHQLIDFAIAKKVQQRKLQAQEASLVNSTEHFRKIKRIPILYKHFLNIEEEEIFSV